MRLPTARNHCHGNRCAQRVKLLPISLVATAEFVLLTNPEKNPSKTAREFAVCAKAQPKFFMASFGAGTPGHFGAYLCAEAAGMLAAPVHYKRAGGAVATLLSGDVPAVFASVAPALTHVKAQARFFQRQMS